MLKHNECANLMLLLFCLETHRTNTFYDNNKKLFICWFCSFFFFLSNFSHNVNLESSLKQNQRLEEGKKTTKKHTYGNPNRSIRHNKMHKEQRQRHVQNILVTEMSHRQTHCRRKDRVSEW